MATKKKLLQAAAGAGGIDAVNVEDVFSNHLYVGSGNNKTNTNGVPIGDSYSLLFFGADTGNSSSYSTSSTGWQTILSLGNQGTPDVNFFIAKKDISTSGTESITVSTSNSNADPSYISFNAVDFSYKQFSRGTGTVELGNLADNSVVFLLEAYNLAQATYTPPSGFTLAYLNNLADLGTSATIAVSYKQFDGGSVSTSGGTFSGSGHTPYRALVEVSAPVDTGVSVQTSAGFNSNVSSFTETTHSLTAPSGVGEGGAVWLKRRDAGNDHYLYDTERGAGIALVPNTTNAGINQSTGGLTSFNTNGFTVGDNSGVNGNSQDMASWTFRKAEKFFDIVTYTGTGSNRTISHNLGTTPGMILVKNTSSTTSWRIWHRSLGNNKYIRFQTDAATTDSSYTHWSSTAHTDTTFSVGSNVGTNNSGSTYIAYLFAHNDGDGEFGPTGDQDIIKCGSVSYNGGASVDLGFEPQWVLIKPSNNTGNWILNDVMRGMPNGSRGPRLDADGSGAEIANGTVVYPTSTGFTMPSGLYDPTDLIYIAIRRGPMAVPDSATDVFSIATTGTPDTVDFRPENVDMAMFAKRGGDSENFQIADRIRTFQSTSLNSDNGYTSPTLETNTSDAEATSSTCIHQSNLITSTGPTIRATTDGSNFLFYRWKRAPNYFDIVAYTGNGSAGRNINHNLGVAPEMIWVKKRSGVEGWAVYHKLNGGTHFLRLHNNNAYEDNHNVWNDTDATDSVFTVDTDTEVNTSGQTYIAYLFASLDGVSKVGSYTGNGTNQNIDCGFSNGARFVLIKPITGGNSWYVWDSTRGIVAGNDPFLLLDTTDAEITGADYIDPYSGGFNVTGGGGTVNGSGVGHIFYAIA